MPETTAETATTDAPTTETTETETATVDLSAEVEKWKAQARKNEERAKANAKAATELEQLKASTMSDTEKAIAEAEARGRTAATAELAVELVDAALEAKSAGRLSPEQLKALTFGLDRAKFLGEDGKVDHQSVSTFIYGIAPAQTTEQAPATPPGYPAAPDLGQGARGTTPALNSDALTQSLKRAVGAT